MRTVATAFTGEALFAGGLDISPRFAAGKPQASVAAFIAVSVAPRASARKKAYRQFPFEFEAISSVVAEKLSAANENTSTRPLHWPPGFRLGRPPRCRRTLSSSRMHMSL